MEIKELHMYRKLFILVCSLVCLGLPFVTLASDLELGNIRTAIQAKEAQWTAGETSMWRLSSEERRKRLDHTSLVQADSASNNAIRVSSQRSMLDNPIPTTFDWRSNGGNFVTPVRDQGSCGSCWVFSTVAGVESFLLRKNKTPGVDLNLSEQAVLSLSGGGTCDGGSADLSSEFAETTGIPLESCSPYTSIYTQTSTICQNWQLQTYKVPGYTSKACSNASAIKEALVAYGPIVLSMQVYEDFHAYTTGIYSHVSGNLDGGHYVLLVGYDDATQSFIVKNSWGTDWGEAGFFRIAYSEMTSLTRFCKDTYLWYYTPPYSGSSYWGSQGSGNGLFEMPWAATVDASDQIYVADMGNNRIQKFSSTGTLIKQWGESGSGNGQLNSPQGIAVDSVGYVYVADTNNNRIQKFSGDGMYVAQWTPSYPVYNPTAIAVDTRNDVLFVTNWSNHVQKLTLTSTTGSLIAQWGSGVAGDGDGQFQSPGGIAVDGSGNVYVADTYNHRIQKFTGNGDFLTKWGTHGTGNGQFQFPHGIKIDGSGNVIVADTSNFRVQKFTTIGTFLTQWSGRHRMTTDVSDTEYVGYEDIVVDSSGSIYVVEADTNQISKFVFPSSHIPLSSGWNLMSMPFQPDNGQTGSVLNSLSGFYRIVWGYPSQSWKFYDSNDSDGSTLMTMEAGRGYWIKMTEAKTLSVPGTIAPSTVSLAVGWNLTGYSGSACTLTSAALTGLSGNYGIVWGYSSQSWKFYDPNDTDGSTLTQICPGYGYWIKMNGAGTWTVP
jgi:C1A family cysteine protease/sugar lactone lactonase YvrE